MMKLKIQDESQHIVPIQETVLRNQSTQPLLVKGLPKDHQKDLQFIENKPRTQTFQKQPQQYAQLDSPIQSRTPTMKNDSFHIQNQSSFPKIPKRPPFVLPKFEGDPRWPFFRVDNDLAIKQFWNRRTASDQNRNWGFNDYLFQGIMLRIGRKKKTSKGYYYRLTTAGLLMYFKKQSDSLPKGYLQLGMQNRVSISIQKSKKNNQLPVLYIERVSGVGITIFDHQIEQTLHLAEALQEFCLLRGFDVVYTQDEELGKGAFAQVFKVVRKRDEKTFACKVYYRKVFEENQHKDRFIQMIYNEVRCLKSVYHPGILRIFELYQERDRFIIVMEYCSGGTLYSFIKQKKRLSEKTIAFILKGIAEALIELHRCSYVHRDMKPENVMFDSKESMGVKIVDFGFAEVINEKDLVSKSGTPGFLAPEIFRGRPYTSKGDVFSVGAMLFHMAVGKHPFQAEKAEQMTELNKKCQPNLEKPQWNDVSTELKYLVKKMMEPKPEDRVTFYDVLESQFIIHHTKSTSETNYRSNQIVSGIDFNRSIKSIRQSQHSNESKDFQLDFSIHTNDMKSLYQRNSQRTEKSNKSNKSLFKNSHKNIRAETRMQDPFLHNEAEQKRTSKSQPPIKEPHDQSNKVKYYPTDNKNFSSLFENKPQDETFRITTFVDQESLTLNQQLFLRWNCNVFNRVKKPTQ